MDTASSLKENFDLLAAVEGMVQLKRTGKWYIGPCPACNEGDDRFNMMQTPNGWRWHCRKCAPGRYWDSIDLMQKVWGTSFAHTVERMSGESASHNTPITGDDTGPAKDLERAIERARRAKEQLEKDLAEAERALQELRSARHWEQYHRNLTNQTRQIWAYRGVPEFWQDWWQLGYDPCKKFLYKNANKEWAEWATPTLTIPVFAPEWKPMQIKHRLLSPPTPNDRYRPEMNGIPPQLWLSDPSRPVEGPTLVVEGEIKGMVTAATYDDERLMVAGLPAKNPGQAALATLANADPIYLLLDPDAQETARAMVDELGKERTRNIFLPMKVDDAIIRYELGKEWVQSLLVHSRRYV
jgi:hypothetical protein